MCFHVHFLTVVRSQMQLSQASALVSESLILRFRADLSNVIAFVNRNILPTPQDTTTKAKDFAWFALRPVSEAHVSIQSTMLLRQRVSLWHSSHVSSDQFTKPC